MNGVPLRRLNQAYVIATSKKVDVSGVALPETVNDSFFVAENGKDRSDFFSTDAPKVCARSSHCSNCWRGHSCAVIM